VFYETDRHCYEEVMEQQIAHAKGKKAADLDKLLKGNEVWTIQ
jgi:2-oxoglutarate ferredoxin oxidoreductase subunit beta